ncbi:DUF1192 domain-containing protein [Litorimonas sp. RW-G-Af-16]|uniref:DUF1192 domain-containing protein n=1 Tax=Litorimonas sp. RW-G-Af-16 TaxID=3241168 RepID=UPI00390C78BB
MDENMPRTGTAPTPGEDLYGLSVTELKDRITLYREEVERLTAALAKKEQELSAADLIFKAKP